MRAAVEGMNNSIGRANVKIEDTRAKIRHVESLLALGAGNVDVGPSNNRRAMDHHQVLYPEGFRNRTVNVILLFVMLTRFGVLGILYSSIRLTIRGFMLGFSDSVDLRYVTFESVLSM